MEVGDMVDEEAVCLLHLLVMLLTSGKSLDEV